ncbi:hypothetical protein X896_6265 [Burkholderia pseudomallei ABCPW 1]|nr:hypothetical protein Y048_5983 [Burkholderia pseudomallei MSHR456]KGX23830.1 hypothetical protein X896_6265 [Burkholderia pseudomallei ABCPW 1]
MEKGHSIMAFSLKEAARLLFSFHFLEKMPELLMPSTALKGQMVERVLHATP